MEYLNVTSELKQFVRNKHNVNEEKIRKYVKILSQWYEEQSNFPELPDAEIYYENALLWNKFNIDRTKLKLQSFYAIKNQLGDEFAQGMCEIIPSNEPTMFFPLSEVTTVKKERIILWMLRDQDPYKFNFEKIVRQGFLLFNFLIKFDYSTGNRFLIDSSGMQVGHILRVNPIAVAKYVKAYLNNLNHKFCGMDFINMPPMHRSIFLLVKSLFPKRLAERIKVHKNLESLHEVIPKECLPEEYDGLLGSKNKLAGNFNEIFLKHKDELCKFILLKGNCKEKTEVFEETAEETYKSLKLLDID